MTLNIKNQDVETLLQEVIQITGETKTEAVRQALADRRQRLATHFIPDAGEQMLMAFLEDEIWPQIPDTLRRVPLTKAEKETILGYGEMGI